jgi:hypothetical protein
MVRHFKRRHEKTRLHTTRHGTAWHDTTTRHDGLRHGTTRQDKTRRDTYDTTRHDTTQRQDKTQHGKTRHDMTRHDMTRHDTTQRLESAGESTVIGPGIILDSICFCNQRVFRRRVFHYRCKLKKKKNVRRHEIGVEKHNNVLKCVRYVKCVRNVSSPALPCPTVPSPNTFGMPPRSVLPEYAIYR